MTRNQKVVRMPGPAGPRKKVVAATRAAVDALPRASGEWKVQGVPGLLVRCGARQKTYRLVRRVAGCLVKRVLGPLSLAEAKRQAMPTWRDLKPKSPGAALDSYLRDKPLAPRTAEDYRYTIEKYLPDLLVRRLDVIALSRADMRADCRHC